MENIADKFRLSNKMPTFREYVTAAFRKQVDDLDKDIKTLQHNKRVVKSMMRDFKNVTEEQFCRMFTDEDKAVIEYKKMRAQIDEYVDTMNNSKAVEAINEHLSKE